MQVYGGVNRALVSAYPDIELVVCYCFLFVETYYCLLSVAASCCLL